VRHTLLAVALFMFVLSTSAEERTAKQLEAERCAPYKEMLEDWDAYIADNFSEKAIKRKSKNAWSAGIQQYGLKGGRKALNDFEDKQTKLKRENIFERMKIVKMISGVGC